MTLINAQEKGKWKHMHAIVEGFCSRPLIVAKYLVDLQLLALECSIV